VRALSDKRVYLVPVSNYLTKVIELMNPTDRKCPICSSQMTAPE
jgi:hypothetical protein